MKKLMSVFLALVMLLSAWAFAEAADVTGEWHGVMYNMPITLVLNEDGTYAMSIDNTDNTNTGAWALEDGLVVVDKGTEAEGAMTFDGETLSMSEGDLSIVFGRGPVEVFAPAEPRADAALEEYTGKWIAEYVTYGEITAECAAAGLDMSAEVNGNAVTLNSESLFLEDMAMNLLFEDGSLGIDFSETAGSSDTVISLTLLEDGMMSLYISYLGQNATFYMTAAE